MSLQTINIKNGVYIYKEQFISGESYAPGDGKPRDLRNSVTPQEREPQRTSESLPVLTRVPSGHSARNYFKTHYLGEWQYLAFRTS